MCAPLAALAATLEGVRDTVQRIEFNMHEASSASVARGSTAAVSTAAAIAAIAAVSGRVDVDGQRLAALEARAKVTEDAGRHWTRYGIVLLLGIVLTVAGFVALQAMKVVQ